MSTVNKIKYNLYKWPGILGAIAMVFVVAYFALRTLPDAKKTIGVKHSAVGDDYSEATEYAMKHWNDWVGCTFLVPGDDIIVGSEQGDPCGDLWRPEEEWGHAATSYDCKDHSEVWVSHPGNRNTVVHIVAHEIGHILGRPHQSIGVMDKSPDPNGPNVMLKISDADKKALKKEFCR